MFKEMFTENRTLDEDIDFGSIKKGLFHKWAISKGFIKSMDDKIPDAAIEAGLKDKDKHVNKMAQFAKNMKEIKEATFDRMSKDIKKKT